MGALHSYFISGVPVSQHTGGMVSFGGSVTPQEATEKALSRVIKKEP